VTGRLIQVARSAYQYPLILKQLWHTPLVQTPDQEIVYRDQKRFSYREIRERIGRLASALYGSRNLVSRWEIAMNQSQRQARRLAIAGGMRVEDLARVPLSFPTYAGILVNAAADAARQLGLTVLWQTLEGGTVVAPQATRKTKEVA
jgi:hypothetical protein